jgi:hypothetical protein
VPVSSARIWRPITRENQDIERFVRTSLRPDVRLAAFNLDLGVRGWWFGHESVRQNGYWVPERFRSDMALAYGYWKISDSDGESLAAGRGAVGDETSERLKFGSMLDVEGPFGVYRDLMLKVRAAVYHNLRQASGAFNAMGLNLLIVCRF